MKKTDWHEIAKTHFKNLFSLMDFLQIEKSKRNQILLSPKFPINVPYRLADKMAKNDLSDPLFLQFVPLKKENIHKEGFSRDPVGDNRVQKEHLLQKYSARALLLCTSRCSIHCRFCFRHHFAYLPESDFSKEIASIEKNCSLEEIILSGGDPLSLENGHLEKLLNKLAKIPHVKRIRIHTRFPIAIPERIDEGLLSLLGSIQNGPLQQGRSENSILRKQLLLVIHTNHPRELDEDVFQSLGKIQSLKIPVLTQTVLLKQINDDPLILRELFSLLVDNGILPYYLHQLDKVKGASHFEVPISKGKKIIKALQSLLPGYAIPRYVQEIAGEKQKNPL